MENISGELPPEVDKVPTDHYPHEFIDAMQWNKYAEVYQQSKTNETTNDFSGHFHGLLQ